MSHVERLYEFLDKPESKTKAGVTVSKIADRTRVPKDSVRKRIFDLRAQGYRIYTNFRKVKGKKKLYYRLTDSD